MSEAVRVIVERPEIDDLVWISRDDWHVIVTTTTDPEVVPDGVIDFPLPPDDARVIARELLRLAAEIDGKEAE